MAKKSQKTQQEYVRLVKRLRSTPIIQPDGTTKNHHIVDGFSAADGFDIRKSSTWTAAQKRQITIYNKEIEVLLSRPVYVYKPRTKKRLKAAQAEAQHKKPLPKITAALFPQYEDKKPIIKFDKQGRIKPVEHNGVKRKLINIPFDELLDEANIPAALNEAIQEQMPDAHMFLVQAGEHEIISAMLDEGGAAQALAHYASAYAAGTDKGERDGGNHRAENWLHGVIGFKSDYLAETSSTIRGKARAGEKYRKQRKKQRDNRKAMNKIEQNVQAKDNELDFYDRTQEFLGTNETLNLLKKARRESDLIKHWALEDDANRTVKENSNLEKTIKKLDKLFKGF